MNGHSVFYDVGQFGPQLLIQLMFLTPRFLFG